MLAVDWRWALLNEGLQVPSVDNLKARHRIALSYARP